MIPKESEILKSSRECVKKILLRLAFEFTGKSHQSLRRDTGFKLNICRECDDKMGMKKCTLSAFKQSMLFSPLFFAAFSQAHAENGREHCSAIEGITFVAELNKAEETSSKFCAEYRKQTGKEFKEHVDACAALGEGKKKFLFISMGGNKYKSAVKSFNKDADLACVALRKAVQGVDKACSDYNKGVKINSSNRNKVLAKSNGELEQADAFAKVSREYADGSASYIKLRSKIAAVYNNLKSEMNGSVYRAHNRTEKNSSLDGVEQYYKKNPKSWIRSLQRDVAASGKKLKNLGHDGGWGEIEHSKQGLVDKCANTSKELETVMAKTKNELVDPYKALQESLKLGVKELHDKAVLLDKDSKVMSLEAKAQRDIKENKSAKNRAPAAEPVLSHKETDLTSDHDDDSDSVK